MTPDEDESVVRAINEAMPEVVWVGLSTPKQERWMAAHVGRLDASVLIGVGAAFDIHAGTLRQAPRWMQRSGLEWLFRLAMEPRRLWRRYVVNIPRFLFAIVRRPPRLRTELADTVIVRPGEGCTPQRVDRSVDSPRERGATHRVSQRRAIAQPDHLVGSNPRGRKILAGTQTGHHLALLRARDRDDDETRARDGGEREGEPGVLVAVVAVADDEATGLVERGSAGEQRCGMTVGSDSEVDDLDRRRASHQLLVRVRGILDRAAAVHAVDRPRCHMIEHHPSRLSLVGVRESTETYRSSPKNTSIGAQSRAVARNAR